MGRRDSATSQMCHAFPTAVGGIPCSLLVTIPFAFDIAWSNGAHSHLNATVNSNPLAGTLGFTGVVTSGPLAGDHVFALGPFGPNVDCLPNGQTNGSPKFGGNSFAANEKSLNFEAPFA